MLSRNLMCDLKCHTKRGGGGGVGWREIAVNIPSCITERSKSLSALDDYNTENYKYCSKCPQPVSRHLLTLYSH
jgi:hypothetical protein